MARYLSREMQRQFGAIFEKATQGLPEHTVTELTTRFSAAIEENNGTPALSFLKRLQDPVDNPLE
jgi:hypothetical protein